MESEDDLNEFHMIKRCSIQASRLVEIQSASSSSKKLVNSDDSLDVSVGDSIWSLGLFGGGGANSGGGGAGYSDIRFIGTRSLPDQTQVYMIMIDQDDENDDEDNSVRVFIEGCNIHTEYILILYIKTNSNTSPSSKSSDSTGSNDDSLKKKKKIILDDFNCIVKVYVSL